MSDSLSFSSANRPSMPPSPVSRSICISLHFEARNLPNMDTHGKSDPFVVVYKREETPSSNDSIPSENWLKLGQTETVYNNLNPKWSTCIPVNYQFGVTTVLKFCIYDRDDNKSDDLSKHDYIGQVKYTLGQIYLAENQCLVSKLEGNNNKKQPSKATLIIRHEQQKGDLGETVTLQFIARKLRRGKKPFYILSNKNPKGDEYSPVFYSEVHKSSSANSHQITFNPVTKSLSRLVNADWDRMLQVELMHYDNRGSHHSVGSVSFSLRTAKWAVGLSNPHVFTLKKLRSNGKTVDAGELIIKRCEISEPFSFVDYVRSGVIINTVFAIDMSNSNGNPIDPQALHYNNRAVPSEYVIAIKEVGSVLAVYDTSRTFPAFGFGAALPPRYSVAEQCFALNGNMLQPQCNGIDGVVDTYYTALSNVAPYQPCNYTPVLQHMMKMTREANGEGKPTVYTIGVIVTDGEFGDFDQVRDCICEAADLPLSIVLIGVGDSRFLQLEALDGDQARLRSSHGIPCSRDIVQFVQFHKHKYNKSELAKEVLAEIPEQLVSYMRNRGMKPSDLVRGDAEIPAAAAETRPIIPQQSQTLPQTPVAISQNDRPLNQSPHTVTPSPHIPIPTPSLAQTSIPPNGQPSLPPQQQQPLPPQPPSLSLPLPHQVAPSQHGLTQSLHSIPPPQGHPGNASLHASSQSTQPPQHVPGPYIPPLQTQPSNTGAYPYGGASPSVQTPTYANPVNPAAPPYSGQYPPNAAALQHQPSYLYNQAGMQQNMQAPGMPQVPPPGDPYMAQQGVHNMNAPPYPQGNPMPNMYYQASYPHR